MNSHELMRALCSFSNMRKLDTLHWLMENIALQLGSKQWTEHNNSSISLPQPFLLHLEEQKKNQPCPPCFKPSRFFPPGYGRHIVSKFFRFIPPSHFWLPTKIHIQLNARRPRKTRRLSQWDASQTSPPSNNSPCSHLEIRSNNHSC